jgi:hypothetical protein
MTTSKAMAYGSIITKLTIHNASAHDVLLLTDQNEMQFEHVPGTRFVFRDSDYGRPYI